MKNFITYIEEKRILDIERLVNPRAVSTPEDKPENPQVIANQSTSGETPITPEPKPQSKVITMKGNTIVTPGSSTEPVRKKVQGQQASPMYTVGKNETLRQIAIRHGLSERELMDLNKGIKDPLKVPPGTQIRTRK